MSPRLMPILLCLMPCLLSSCLSLCFLCHPTLASPSLSPISRAPSLSPSLILYLSCPHLLRPHLLCYPISQITPSLASPISHATPSLASPCLLHHPISCIAPSLASPCLLHRPVSHTPSLMPVLSHPHVLRPVSHVCSLCLVPLAYCSIL